MTGPKDAASQRHFLLRADIAIPFLLVSLIWGSTWFVIKGQLDDAPASWSVAYRFIIACLAMFVLAWRSEGQLRMARGGHIMAFALGFMQFCLNLNFIYHGELYLTSGIVAVMFMMLLLPNAVLGRIYLGTPITLRFVLGTMVAMGGIALLLMHESRSVADDASISGDELLLGIVLTVLGILAASIANIMQATPSAQRQPLLVLLAWAMLWGAILDTGLAFSLAGAPPLPPHWDYWASIVYLAVFGSVVTFPLHYQLVRKLGAGRAAYSSVLVPVVAMVLSTAFEGFQLDVTGRRRRGAGIAGHGDRAAWARGAVACRAFKDRPEALRDKWDIAAASQARAWPCCSPRAGSPHKSRAPSGKDLPPPY